MEKSNDKKNKHNITLTLSSEVYEVIDRIANVNRRTKKQQLEATIESVFLNYETVKKLLGLL